MADSTVGQVYYRRVHPSSNILIKTSRDDPQSFPGMMSGLLMRDGDDRKSGTPRPWFPYDPDYRQSHPCTEEEQRKLEGLEMMAKKVYGVVASNAEPVFLSQYQMDAAGLYTLCHMCQSLTERFILNVNSRWSEEDQGMSEEKHLLVRHYEDTLALKTSAEAGCHLCSILDLTDQGTSEALQYEIWLTPNQIILKPERGTFKKIWLRTEYHRPYLSTVFTERNTGASPVLDHAKEWLSRCMAEHTTCCRTEPSSVGGSIDQAESESPVTSPFRLIEVVHLNGEVESARLTTLPTVNAEVKYLTLSHCWGGADIVKLTQASLAQLEADIPMGSLPKNFAEALKVTAHLGFNYIWIDSLCVVQDSPEDWELQSQQMGKIYWRSSCTIAALKAQTPCQGLFSRRPVLSMTKCLVARDGGPAAHNQPVFAQAGYEKPKPLHTRGWVVQERYLSRRTINFGADMVTWSCVTATATEDWPQFDHRADYEPARQLYEMTAYTYHPVLVLEGHWLGRWWALVEDYTGKNLSFASDRFRAIEGLARIIQERKRISMVHGLWQPFLITELLWSLDMIWDAPAITTTGTQQKSPTWSWLGINRVVQHYDLRSVTYRMTAVVAHQSEHPSWEPKLPMHMITGNTGHVLTIKGPMLPIQYVAPHSGKERLAGHQIHIYPFRLCDGRTFPVEEEDQYFDGHWKPDRTIESGYNLFAAELIQRRYRDDHLISTGLIMHCIVDQRHYARVGMYEVEWGTRKEKGRRRENGAELGYKLADTWQERDGERWFGETRLFTMQ
jgi:hypothetical protein